MVYHGNLYYMLYSCTNLMSWKNILFLRYKLKANQLDCSIFKSKCWNSLIFCVFSKFLNFKVHSKIFEWACIVSPPLPYCQGVGGGGGGGGGGGEKILMLAKREGLALLEFIFREEWVKRGEWIFSVGPEDFLKVICNCWSNIT